MDLIIPPPWPCKCPNIDRKKVSYQFQIGSVPLEKKRRQKKVGVTPIPFKTLTIKYLKCLNWEIYLRELSCFFNVFLRILYLFQRGRIFNILEEGYELVTDDAVCRATLAIPGPVKTDLKFIGKVESQTNNFLKSSVLAHFTWNFFKNQ